MADPISTTGSLKGLIKNPLFYAIAIFVIVGGYIVKENQIGPTWFVGLGLVIFACIMFVVHVIVSLFDISFKRRYDGLINAQDKTIKSQSRVIKEMTNHTLSAFSNISSASETISGGYVRKSDISGTETITSGDKF